MKVKSLILTTITALFVTASYGQQENGRFSIEINGGASFATQKLDGVNPNTGFGFEGILHYRFLPHTGVYAGWGWNQFSTEKPVAKESLDYEETGYLFGLQFEHPIGTSSVGYFLRAGTLYYHIEVESETGEITGDTGHGFGWQVAGGVSIPLGSQWSLLPGFKFNSLSRDLTEAGQKTSLDLRYLSGRIAIRKTF